MHLVWIRHCLQGLFSEAHRSSLPCRQSRYCHSSTLYNIWFAFIICFIQTSNAFNECVTAWFMPNILNLLQFQLLLVQKTCSSVPWPTSSKYCYIVPHVKGLLNSCAVTKRQIAQMNIFQIPLEVYILGLNYSVKVSLWEVKRFPPSSWSSLQWFVVQCLGPYILI